MVAPSEKGSLSRYLTKMERIKISNQKLNISIVILTFVLLVSAHAHRLQMNDTAQQYTKSVLIQFEFITLISLFILYFVNSMCLFRHLVKKELTELYMLLGISCGSFFIVVVAMVIDAPTLIYMT